MDFVPAKVTNRLYGQLEMHGSFSVASENSINVLRLHYVSSGVI